jgi:hypothetical protein
MSFLRNSILVALTALATPMARAAEDSSSKQSLPVPLKDTYVEVIERIDGDPVLVIRYPWHRHVGASVEVRFLYDDEVEERLIYPLYFADRYMKDNVTVALYRAQDGAEDVPTIASFSRAEIQFAVFGDRNSLGNASAAVACTTETVSLAASRRTPRAVFPVLEPWALDRRTLYLDLRPEYFPNPCKIRIWLMRGEDIVWTETANWPGYPGEQEPPPAE